MSTPDPKSYWEDRLGKNFNLHGVGYLGLGVAWNTWVYRVRAAVFKRLLRSLRLDRAHISVLDVGSGTGFYIDRWRKAGVKNLVGSDLTATAVAQLGAQFPDVQFHQIDIGDERVPLEAQSFDVVSAFDVLFHIVDSDRYRRAIENCFSLVRPGGYFLFSDFFLHQGENRGPQQESRHLPEIEAAVRDAGFEIVRRVPMFVLMNNPVDSTSERLRRFWLWIRNRIQKGGDRWGSLIGGSLYPIEILLTRFVSESPTSEIMVCRKPSNAEAKSR